MQNLIRLTLVFTLFLGYAHASKKARPSALWKAMSTQDFVGLTAKGGKCALEVNEHRPAVPVLDQIKWSESFVLTLRVEDQRGHIILSELSLAIDPTLGTGKDVTVKKNGSSTEYVFTNRYHATTVGSMGSVINTRTMVFEIDTTGAIRSFRYKLDKANSSLIQTTTRTMHDYNCTL